MKILPLYMPLHPAWITQTSSVRVKEEVLVLVSHPQHSQLQASVAAVETSCQVWCCLIATQTLRLREMKDSDACWGKKCPVRSLKKTQKSVKHERLTKSVRKWKSCTFCVKVLIEHQHLQQGSPVGSHCKLLKKHTQVKFLSKFDFSL